MARTCPPAAGSSLQAADAIVLLASPTYMGSVSWQFKKFADASSTALVCPGREGQAAPPAPLTAPALNGDKQGTFAFTLFTLAMQHEHDLGSASLDARATSCARRSVTTRNYLVVVQRRDRDLAQRCSRADAMSPGDLENRCAMFGERVATRFALSSVEGGSGRSGQRHWCASSSVTSSVASVAASTSATRPRRRSSSRRQPSLLRDHRQLG